MKFTKHELSAIQEQQKAEKIETLQGVKSNVFTEKEDAVKINWLEVLRNGRFLLMLLFDLLINAIEGLKK